GRALAPGFVDVHSHADLSAIVVPEMPSLLRQGITTVVVGNCGSSPWPWVGWDEGLALAYGEPGSVPRPAGAGFGDYLTAVGAGRPAANVAALVGHGTIRREVLGAARRPPTTAELARMRALVDEAMDAGAFGLSSGLIYVPGISADTDEVTALAQVAAARDGLYASHIRGEGRDLFAAIDEAFAIGRGAGLPVHVSHLKCESSRVWGRAGGLLETLHEAEDATGDQYPYAAWNSSLASLLPPWAPATEVDALVRDDRERLRAAVEEGEPGFQSSVDGVGWDRIVVVDPPDERWRGRDVAAIAQDLGVAPFDACVRLLREFPDTSCIGHAMHDDDVRTILADPEVFVACDGSATAPHGPGGDLPVHPREYGTFPRALARCREEGLLPLEAAIRKLTGGPAERFGLRDRGTIVEGAFADLVLLDPSGVTDTATYEHPHAYPVGISMVVVNGEVAWEDATGAIQRHGRVLRR
ncbi:MAG TPA: amidohydrolase family protein, partial [Actinomycetota bacterium]